MVTLYSKASEIRPVSHHRPELSEINHVVLTGIGSLTPAISELLFLPLFPFTAPWPILYCSTPVSIFSLYTQGVSCIFLTLSVSLSVYLEFCPRSPPGIFSLGNPGLPPKAVLVLFPNGSQPSTQGQHRTGLGWRSSPGWQQFREVLTPVDSPAKVPSSSRILNPYVLGWPKSVWAFP